MRKEGLFTPSHDLQRVLVTSMAYTIVMILASKAYFYVPWTPVPFTLQTYALLAGALLLGPVEAAGGILLYLFTGGFAGVFASGTTLAGVLGGPTGGYVLGFVVTAPLASALRSRVGGLAAAAMGLGVVYLLGTFWLSIFLGVSLSRAFQLGVLPFILVDVIKLSAAVVTVRMVRG